MVEHQDTESDLGRIPNPEGEPQEKQEDGIILPPPSTDPNLSCFQVGLGLRSLSWKLIKTHLALEWPPRWEPKQAGN